MDRTGWHYPPGDLRVSDADRDRALAELSQAFQAGRITADEFDERSGQALHSRTGKELTGRVPQGNGGAPGPAGPPGVPPKPRV